jgi:hypothetical protein
LRPVEKQGHADNLLGRGSHHHHLPAEQSAHQGPQRHHPIQGLAWPQTGCAAPVHVQLCGIHQGNYPAYAQARQRRMQVVFISYEKVAKEWRFYNPASGRAIVSRDAIFDEQASWSWEKPSEDDGDITIEYHTLELGEPQGVQAHTAGTPTPTAHTPTLEPATSVHAARPVSVSPPPQPKFVSPQPKFVSPQPNTEEYLNATPMTSGPGTAPSPTYSVPGLHQSKLQGRW